MPICFHFSKANSRSKINVDVSTCTAFGRLGSHVKQSSNIFVTDTCEVGQLSTHMASLVCEYSRPDNRGTVNRDMVNRGSTVPLFLAIILWKE